eukprot:TCALIF_10709-PA protein Name:"Similar to naa38 N-alpha-acetyltransferase 38, NatC auxiliary subunit (Danio rerio)" AED:0.36 eAED:0.38 QI:118/0/0.5/1/0/0/2/0/167
MSRFAASSVKDSVLAGCFGALGGFFTKSTFDAALLQTQCQELLGLLETLLTDFTPVGGLHSTCDHRWAHINLLYLPNMTPEKTSEMGAQSSPGRALLRSWLNKHLKVVLSDGRILVGVFLCTDQNANVILGSCTESTPEQSEGSEPRILGLAMVPGRHILSVHVDEF